MRLLKIKSQRFAPAVIAILCITAGSVGAQDEFTWPVNADLVYSNVDLLQVWSDAGDISVWNTKDTLYIRIIARDGLMLSEVAMHIVDDPADFEAILDRGRPVISSFDYRTDYLGDHGDRVGNHLEAIDLSEFDVCWGMNSEMCPPNRYMIVAAILQRPEMVQTDDGIFEEVWVDLPGTAFARNDGIFDRFPGSDDTGAWSFYVTYPLAKVEPGRFIDANVNGLDYYTITQAGTTGDNGQFWYLPDERIAFSLGRLRLGDALGDRVIWPADLFDGAGIDDVRTLNLARLLQSLDADGNPGQGAINITDPVISCLNTALRKLSVAQSILQPVNEFPFRTTYLATSPSLAVSPSDFRIIPPPDEFFSDSYVVGTLIDMTIRVCDGEVDLTAVSMEDARDNLNAGLRAGNFIRKNVSKTPSMKSDKAKIEILPVYVPAKRSDDTPTSVVYFDENDEVIEERFEAKPIVVSYLDEIEATGSYDVFVAISRDDGDTWKRRNLSKTADKSSLLGYPGDSKKPMLKAKDNMIFVAWTDKYCHGGRPGYAITVCPDTTGDGLADPCEICRETEEGTICTPDYQGDDAYWQDDLFGVGGPQRSVIYEEFPDMGERPYSCVWTIRATIESDGDIQWFKPERLTSGRRDAYQLFAGAGTDVAFAIVWQEDPKGLRPGEGEGPGDGWSGARSSNKTDIWYSYITLDDFGLVDNDYPASGPGHDNDIVDWDPDLAGRVKALVPMSMPVRISDNDVCSAENMNPTGPPDDHEYDEDSEGTHRYCGDIENIGTAESPGSNPLCAYTVEKANPNDEIHHVCVTADGRFLDGNTGASRANVFLQPYTKPDGTKSAWAIIGYEESKGVGIPPLHDDDGCGDDHAEHDDDDHDTKYKPDEGKNVIYHSFDFSNPVAVDSGGILNLPETDANGSPIYLVDEFGELLLDWKGDPQLAYENARRVRFISQPKSKRGPSGTVLVGLYRQGEEGKGKPADVFMRRAVASQSGNPYAFANFVPGAKNISSVEPTVEWQDPFDPDKPVKMLRWTWSPANLEDKSAKNPNTDSRAQRGAINGDELFIGYSWTPNWGRAANDKYDFYARRSFNGGQSWTTDPGGSEIEHHVVFRVPVEDYDTQTISWDEEVVTMAYLPGDLEPPRNLSNLRNNRISVLEPRLVKTPGTIKIDGVVRYPEDQRNSKVYQLAYGLEFNQNQLPGDAVFPQMPLDIFYSRTRDRGQHYESVVVTPQGGGGRPGEGWNTLANDRPEQGAAQLRQTPDGSRMYGIWLEESDQGSDIMFRRVDYRGASD